jgi:hypothetical protein
METDEMGGRTNVKVEGGINGEFGRRRGGGE